MRSTNLSSASTTSSTSLSSTIPTFLSSVLPTNTSTSLYASSTDVTSFSFSTPVTAQSSTTFASSILSSSPSPLSDSTSTWTTGSSSAGWSSSSDYSASPTYSGTAGNDGSGTATPSVSTSPATSTSASSDSSGGGTAPQTKEVVGGVFGGIAGVALLIGLAFMILRMKKRGWCHLRLGGEDDGPSAASRALPASGGGGGGAGAGAGGDASGAYGTMQQRSAPQSVAASLAAMTGKRSSRDRAGSGSEMAERGFVRVSGRKLPPVLQYGGDGYTDPRNSQLSEASASVYRDSMAVFDQPNATRLALGSPMRPESGIMTMQPGPAKTPVTSQAPSHIDSPTLPRSSTHPPTDAIGRTLAAHDFSRDGAASRDSRGSHASRGSTRFTEHVT